MDHGLTRDEMKLFSGHGSLKNLEVYTWLSLENVQRKYEQAGCMMGSGLILP
jgi:hypothetical protein